MDDNRLKALTTVLATIEKKFGKGAAMFGDAGADLTVEAFSSGSLLLDTALGVGGYPRGRIVETYGNEASGKTTLCLQAIASVQRTGGVAAFIDAEHALDPAWAALNGVKFDEHQLILSQPNSGEQALEIVDEIVRSGAVDLIVVDSVAALTPQAEIDGEMSDMQVGLQARLMSKALRKIAATASQTGTTIIFINQLREKIGGMGYGDPTTTTGGRALKFYASVRLDVRRIATLKHREDVIGSRIKIKVTKNKVAPPFRQVETEIMYNEGLSRSGEIIDLAVEYGLMKKSGAWFSYNGENVGQGREGVREWLKTNPDIADTLTQRLLDEINGVTGLVDISVVDDEPSPLSDPTQSSREPVPVG